MSKVYYLQVEANGLAAGTACVYSEPTTAHLQAKTMLKGTMYPTRYVTPLGSHEVVAVEPSVLGELHPLDPRLTAPVQIHKVDVGVDRLPGNKAFRLSVDRQEWPYGLLMIVLDDQALSSERICVDEIIAAVETAAVEAKVVTDFGPPAEVVIDTEYLLPMVEDALQDHIV